MREEDIFEEARKKVEAKKGFFYHFLAYAFVLALLSFIMYFENGGNYFPVVVVALSWGIGIATHYFKAFGTENLATFGINPDWEEEQLENEIEKLRRKRELKEELRNEKMLLDDLDRLELKELEKRTNNEELDN